MINLQFAVNLILVAIIILMAEKHRRNIERVYDLHTKERQALLDRIMSNNIQEFKAASGQSSVKRSETGNYLIDQMKKRFSSIEEIDE